MGITLDLASRRDANFDPDYFRADFVTAGPTANSSGQTSRSATYPGNYTASSVVKELPLPSLPQIVSIQSGNDAATLQDVPVPDLVDYFWTDRADSACVTCAGTFRPANPPVRTISLLPDLRDGHDQQGQKRGGKRKRGSSVAIRVNNRHLGCLQRAGPAVALVSMSHVWDKAVSNAHLRRHAIAEAASCIYHVVERILPVVTHALSSSPSLFRFPPGQQYPPIELWHDYVSVPQWQPDIQQSLLLRLPDIYAVAALCLIHLDDVAAETIEMGAASLPPPASGGDGNEDDANRQAALYDALATFFRARWFSRMWVTLEYAHCRRAFVYTSDDKIVLGNHDATRAGGDGAFAHYLDGALQRMRVVIETTSEKAFSRLFARVPVPILGPLIDMRRTVQRQGQLQDRGQQILSDHPHQEHPLTFGEVLSFVAGRSCQNYRDRFLAMTCFLGVGGRGNKSGYGDATRQIPPDPVQACLWLARKCLARGDYSPLLVLQNGEAACPGAPWLAGHRDMRWWMWDVGPVTSWAAVPPAPGEAIRLVDDDDDNDGRISLDHLHLVGHLEAFYPDNDGFRVGDPITALDNVLTLFLTHSDGGAGEGFDGPGFVATLARIYPIPDSARTPPTRTESASASLSAPPPLTWADYTQGAPQFAADLKMAVRAYLRVPCWSAERLARCREMARLLRFYDPLPGTLSSYTRLTYGRSALGLTSKYLDGIGGVRCHGCVRLHLYRFIVLKSAQPWWNRIHLYRIPGLGYASSACGGVGFLGLDGHVVGRMIYGTPACDCKVAARFVVGEVMNNVSSQLPTNPTQTSETSEYSSISTDGHGYYFGSHHSDRTTKPGGPVVAHPRFRRIAFSDF